MSSLARRSSASRRSPVSWWFVLTTTAVWLGLSYIALSDVWVGMWRSFAIDAQLTQEQFLGHRQMTSGAAAFTCVLFAFVFTPKRSSKGLPINQQYIWTARVGVAVALLVVALSQFIEAHHFAN